MVDALGAPGPRPDLAERLMLFGQFVGSWDVDVENITADGQVTLLKAEWHFGWALEGRAVMDVWIAPPRSEPSETGRYEYGASLRYYDESIDAWRSTWIGPVRHLVRPFIARQVGSEIILEGSFEPGTRQLGNAVSSPMAERFSAAARVKPTRKASAWLICRPALTTSKSMATRAFRTTVIV